VTRRSLAATGFGAMAVLLLSGCASGGGTIAAPQLDRPDGYLCDGVSVSRDAVEDRVPLSAMGDAARAAITIATWDDRASMGIGADEGWYAVTATEDRIALLRDVPADGDPSAPGATAGHEVAELFRVDDRADMPAGWYAARRSMCTLTADLGELTVPDIALASPSEPGCRDVRLLVTERGCASGMDAEGRIEVVSLEETEDAVRVELGVRPRAGGQDCPGHPATPFTLALAEPLRDRAVIDAAGEHERELTAAG
jgi:hypothetical protein